jgi:hypothetical protein
MYQTADHPRDFAAFADHGAAEAEFGDLAAVRVTRSWSDEHFGRGA